MSGASRKGGSTSAQRIAQSAARQAVAASRRHGPAVQQQVMAKFSSNAYRRRAVEVKTCDFQFTGPYAAAYVVDTQPLQQLNTNSGTACVQALNLFQQGTGIAQRDGNKVSLKSLRLRLGFQNQGASPAVTQDNLSNVRIMVVYDRQPNGAAGAGAYPASNNILGESLQSNSIGTGTMYSNLNPNYFERMRVLMDKQITLPPSNLGGLPGTNVTGPTQLENFKLDEYINLKDLETLYNGTANPMTIAQITTGALYIVCYGDTAAATQPWTIIGTARLRFHDN